MQFRFQIHTYKSMGENYMCNLYDFFFLFMEKLVN